MHCTTQPEIGLQRGFGQWLQLMHCANLLAAGLSISIINVHKFRTQLELSVEFIMKQVKNLNRHNSEYRGISNRPGIQIMKADYF